VDALDLDVEHRRGVALDAGARGDPGGEPALVGELDGAPLLLEPGVVGQRLEPAQLVEVAQPVRADAGGDQPCEPRVAEGDEAARGDAVGDVEEPGGPQPAKSRSPSGSSSE
jgi:hypothetical protein